MGGVEKIRDVTFLIHTTAGLITSETLINIIKRDFEVKLFNKRVEAINWLNSFIKL
uniref:DUF7793 family protein n=1 Tax=Mariniflexile litorale TaxID=3045158 RepID=UPI003F68C4B8